MPLNDTSDIRFWSKVNFLGPWFSNSPCWLWTAYTNPFGHGQFRLDTARNILAHQFSYITMRGAIPLGLELDHLCKNPPCVNPWHLEAVTHQVNMERADIGFANATWQHSKTHCPQDHPYDLLNTYFHRGQRHCRICMRQHNRNWKMRHT